MNENKPRRFDVLRSPVAKYMNEFNKPKTFRNRKKEAKKDGNYAEHPKHRPYKRENIHLNNYLLEDDIDGS